MNNKLNQVKIKNWLLHFFLLNLIVIYTLAFNYLASALTIKLYSFGLNGFETASFFEHWKVNLFLFITFISYFSLLTLIVLLIPYLLTKLFARSWLTIGMSVLCISCLIVFILIDLFVFKLYRFHLNSFIFNMIFSQDWHQIFYFSKDEWRFFYFIVASILLLEVLFATLLWFNKFINLSTWIIRFIYSSIILMIISFCSTVIGSKYLIRESTIFPYYTEVARHLFAVSKKKMNYMVYSHYFAQSQFANHTLHYPIKPLQCSNNSKLPNLFIILIDTWRFDAMNEKTTPNIFHFAAENLLFQNHFSGGNATQPGVFSLFYAIPASYWTAVLEQGKNPELINQLINKNYQFGVFASASLAIPDFAFTIFKRIANLPTSPSGSAYQRDQVVTKRFIEFLAKHNPKQPIFSFIFYDSAHDFCEKSDYKGPFQPELEICKRYLLNNYQAQPYINRYKNAVHFTDQQIAQVLTAIKKAKLWDNSIIIISGDHGEEFDDNHGGFWGHTSNFSKFQVEVPFIVRWPGKSKQQYSHITTHYDLVPTLLSEALTCSSDYANYSSGLSLFDDKNRYPIIVSGNYNVSYHGSETITNLFPSGDFEIQNLQTKPLPNSFVDTHQLQSVLYQINRFYQQPKKELNTRK